MQEKTPGVHDADAQATIREFHAAVNMTPAKIEHWLGTAEAKAVGYRESEGRESVGHHSGRRIVEILRTNRSDLTQRDIDHMRKVVGFVHRHLAQRPEGDVSHTPWRHSLMNWGHDPSAK